MAEVAPVRSTFDQKDVGFKRGVSEATLTKQAAQHQFINKFQTDIKEFKLNGTYRVATGIEFFDGVASFFYNSEIVGINFWNGRSGVSGKTDFDIRWIDTDGIDQGSIFSTLPSINSSSPDKAVGFRNLETGEDVASVGVTLPVLSKSQFLQGESVYMILTDAMAQALNGGISIFYRPIN